MAGSPGDTCRIFYGSIRRSHLRFEIFESLNFEIRFDGTPASTTFPPNQLTITTELVFVMAVSEPYFPLPY